MKGFEFDPGAERALEGRYELLSCLKHTEYRQVYLARDIEDGERVVLKLGSGRAAERLAEEYALLDTLSGGSFPRAKALLELSGYTALAREYVPGVTLRDHADTRQLSADSAVKLALHASRIVRVLHERHVPLVHRDLSPGNFVLRDDGTLCLIDLDSVHAGDERKSMDTMCLGTPGTAAPEQYGAGRSGTRADVYGVGMLLVYLLTGGYDMELFQRQRLPAPLVRAVCRATQFDPKRRYATLAQLERALKRSLMRPPRALAAVLASFVVFGVGLYAGFFVSDPPNRSSDIVRFTSAPIAAAVQAQLGIPIGQISFDDLRRVETLLIVGDDFYGQWDEVVSYGKENVLCNYERNWGTSDVIQLDDVRAMPNLSCLGIYNSYISDLAPIRGLKLSQLSISNSAVSDLSPIGDMTTLEALDICATNVQDLAPLAGLTQLKTLRMVDCPATDMRPLSGLSIEELMISGTLLTDAPETLTELKSLRELSVNGIPEHALPFINQVSWLQELSAIFYPCPTLRDIGALSNLTMLYVINMGLTSLDGIEQFHSLEHLTFMNLDSADATPIASLPMLRRLYLINSRLTNMDALTQLPRLEELLIPESDIASLPEFPSRVSIRAS